jgi:DNA polymerase-1
VALVNFQNLPARDERAGRLKRAFVPKCENGAFICADYEAMEFRVAAAYLAAQPTVKDFTWVEEILSGDDPHMTTAHMIRKLLRIKEEPTKKDRDRAKTALFSQLYNGTWRTIQNQGLAPDAESAQEFCNALHKARPQIAMLTQMVKRVMEDRGHVKTVWGRQLTGDLNLPMWKRPMVNYLIQGSSADILKDGLINIYQFLQDGMYESHLVMQIHDEVIIDAVDEEIESIVENLPRLMGNEWIEKFVPLGIDIEIARPSWADQEPYLQQEPVLSGSPDGPLPWEE